MEPLVHFAPYTGWVYPNETVIEWSIAIVVYPYITGLVAGAFTVSSLYQVFGFQRLKPVAHLALLTSLCFMIFVPLRCCTWAIRNARSRTCSRRTGRRRWPCSATSRPSTSCC